MNIRFARLAPETPDGKPGEEGEAAGVRDVRILRVCAVVLVVLAIVTASYAASAILMPLTVAVVLALLLAPVATAFERLYLPSGLAAIATMMLFVSLVVVGVTAVTPALADWMDRLPDVMRSAERKLRPVMEQLRAVERASTEIGNITALSPPDSSAPVVANGDGPLTSAMRTAPEVLASTIFVVVLTIFLLAFRESYYNRLIMLPQTLKGRLRAARVLRDVRECVSGYLFILVCINTGVGVVTAAAFTIAGIPDALFWGFAFAVGSFVPVIGPTTVILASAVFGFATADTAVGALTPPAILLAIDAIESHIITPLLVSRRLVTSPIAILVAVAFFVWLWGPLAAMVAVPGLILFHTVTRHFSDFNRVAMLLSADDAWRRHERRGRGRNSPLHGFFARLFGAPRRPTPACDGK
jgi:predicted PurR-regulated permease PerM